MAGEKIVRLLKQTKEQAELSQRASSIVFGQVTSLTPMEIKVESRYTITEDFILLSSLCLPKTIIVKFEIPLGETTVKVEEEVEVWRGLKVGDKVRMIRAQGGQMYYVLDREGGLTIE